MGQAQERQTQPECLARGAGGCTFVTSEKSLKGAQRSYKQKAATKQHKDLFPALEQETAERRKQRAQGVKWPRSVRFGVEY